MARVILGVAGGIAAYKACEVIRRLRDSGHDVCVVPTANALNFVGATTWEALSGHPVNTDVWTGAADVPHVRLGQEADLVLVAPATADLLARAAAGRADDLLTNVLLTAHCPVVMFPAMHTEMWLHAATRANVATLRERGVVIADPDSGRLTGADSGPGRLPDPVDIRAVAEALLERPELAGPVAARDMAGLRVVVSAGGTQEALDPVRFLGNHSSGLMGIGIARAALLRGAEVTLVAARMDHEPPAGVEVRRVVSTGDLARAMQELSPSADVVVMAAAPADFTAADPADRKIKKQGTSGLTLELVQTTDVLASLAADRPSGQTLVGFAAETADSRAHLVELGTTKLAHKGADLLVCNDVTGGKVFGHADTAAVIIDRSGIVAECAGSKDVVAHSICDAVLAERAGR
ncbi:bifunctional phosphopantothenoylcysteine decarboxylase/phosphopantothenate--cysteine ligase CoaBC [Raineyella fluvialis]|uniref:Coenzyme A biosynthesis bifunctional protein CoaBC n=1 Tax=Raineyella fluvialis TaxID=2662261 RepID=A0A5Q2FHD2_9ACTN|nr:bifunctional phosphopantothenoylcysteine decarboxylase/phosphopantothenate--cysteine ligase CoaBC [Raineyella fluvialis]QGF24533.1 bifunctional phosphopantothenoylcysteine decarboxylase/phosphopantothenate--cysteine ligase CoaBC [Raineyella fluvialis]